LPKGGFWQARLVEFLQSWIEVRIAMLGWEFPPFSAGGLGVHCRDLTTSLAALGARVDFFMPNMGQPIHAPWMNVIYVSPEKAKPVPQSWAGAVYSALKPGSGICKPASGISKPASGKTFSNEYGMSFFQGLELYNRAVVEAFAEEHAKEPYSVVHAHDWITARAGVEIRRRFGVPLVQTMHSTEYDRTGGLWPCQWIVDIERTAVQTADRVIAVSNYTREQLIWRYGASPGKVRTVYNGVEPGEFRNAQALSEMEEWTKGPLVLFHGRLSIQKGAEFFLKAAKRVLEVIPGAKFVVSGKGDQLPRLVEQALGLGILKSVFFTGYVPQEKLPALYKASDVYVLSSVSEPFGITVLEAMSAGTPVIVTKTSGVGEALRHALKVDFWDTDEMANKIVGILRYPSLKEELRKGMEEEVPLFSWERCAEGTYSVYWEVAR